MGAQASAIKFVHTKGNGGQRMKFVNFQTDRLKKVGLLSDAEAGKVLKMMAQYASNGNVPDDVPPVSAILFQAIQEDMEYFHPVGAGAEGVAGVAGRKEAPLAVQGLGDRAVQDKGQDVAEEVQGDEDVEKRRGQDAVHHGHVTDCPKSNDRRRQDTDGIEQDAGRFVCMVAFQRHEKHLLLAGFGGVTWV